MHRSRLTSALIDVPDAVFRDVATFWSGALGTTASDSTDGDYIEFDDLTGGLRMMVQRTGNDTAARVHLDIETDDVDAEVARLERLGATKVEQVQTWWVMRDPAGLLFCVVRVQTPEEFEANATTWKD